MAKQLIVSVVTIIAIIGLVVSGCTTEIPDGPYEPEEPVEEFAEGGWPLFAETCGDVALLLTTNIPEDAVDLSDLEQAYDAVQGRFIEFAGELQTLGGSIGVDTEGLEAVVAHFTEVAQLFGDAAINMAQDDVISLAANMVVMYERWVELEDPVADQVPEVYEAFQELLSAFGDLHGTGELLGDPELYLEELEMLRDFYLDHTHEELQQMADSVLAAVEEAELVELFGFDDPEVVYILENIAQILGEPEFQEWLEIAAYDESLEIATYDLSWWVDAASRETFVVQSIALGEAFSALSTAINNHIPALLMITGASAEPCDTRNVKVHVVITPDRLDPTAKSAMKLITYAPKKTPGTGPAIRKALDALDGAIAKHRFNVWVKVTWEHYEKARHWYSLWLIKCNRWVSKDSGWSKAPPPAGDVMPGMWDGTAVQPMDDARKAQLEKAIQDKAKALGP